MYDFFILVLSTKIEAQLETGSGALGLNYTGGGGGGGAPPPGDLF